jgi:putative ABC transport system substrate-binding protein
MSYPGPRAMTGTAAGRATAGRRARVARRGAGAAAAFLMLVLGPPAGAEPPRTARIGYLSLYAPADFSPGRSALGTRLEELGWREGRNVILEVAHADGAPARLAQLAGRLARQNLDVIVASGISAVLAARQAAPRTPIVIAGASDPVAFGLVATLAHPGGNVTGVADTPGRELEGKRLETLKELAPRATRIAVVLDSSGRRDPVPILAAARALGLTPLISPETATPEAFRKTFAALRRDGAQAVYAPETPVNAEHRDLIITLATEHRLPAMYGSREFVDAGGLAAYGPSYADLHRRAAEYVDRILRGASPASLPVEQPSRLELAINLKTAAAIGLAVPPAVLLRADHVVQ